jgi:ubiquitin-conjugating enzyme E2 Z
MEKTKTVTTNFISKESITRLLGDVRQIMKNPLTDNGIYYIHDDTDMLKGYALIIGPEDTPYFAGNYFFEFQFPTDYPFSPPKVIYKTNDGVVRFNPNLYVNGKVCVSVLNTWRGEQWTSCQNISTILLTLCTLLCNNPLLNEPGINKNHPDYNTYTKIIEFANMEVAVCDMVNKKSSIYPEEFEIFYPYVKENFEKNHQKISNFLEKMEINDSVILESTVYRFKKTIDYKNLIKKFKEASIKSGIISKEEINVKRETNNESVFSIQTQI